MTILDRIDDMLTAVERQGRTPTRIVLGHAPAADLEAALYRPAETIRGLLGEVIAEQEEIATYGVVGEGRSPWFAPELIGKLLTVQERPRA